MTKIAIIDAIQVALKRDFDTFRNASQQTRQSGNDDETRADGKYDTQSTEANYLADGQAKHAREVVQAIAAYDSLDKREFDESNPIAVGALVELGINRQPQWFFLGPACGGLEVCMNGRTITVVTPGSPLGSQLIDRRIGDHISSPAAEILSVS